MRRNKYTCPYCGSDQVSPPSVIDNHFVMEIDKFYCLVCNMVIDADMMVKKKRNKYGARKVTIDGIKFDSTGEGQRYSQLKLLAQAGEITDLVCHPPFELFPATKVNGEKLSSVQYTPDFMYTNPDGERIVEDYKGNKKLITEAARVRINLFRRQYPGMLFRIVTKEDL